MRPPSSIGEREGRHWLEILDLALLRRLVGQRTLDHAIASGLRYSAAPALGDSGIFARLTDGHDTFDVFLRMPPDRLALLGGCSRCSTPFGPCFHVATVAVDLVCSAPLGRALLEGRSIEEASTRAPDLRLALSVELKFERALRTWLAPVPQGIRVEISATPFAEPDLPVGRAYGDRSRSVHAPVLSIVVRHAGERKLLTALEIGGLGEFSVNDRRVLEYARDRGAGRKAAYVRGVEASIAIEAMRTHGGVFAAGFKALLDFRSSFVRPSITVARALPFDELSAFWIAESAGKPISFAESVFFPGPFPFVWTKTGALYRVAPEVDLDFASQLAQAPVLRVPEGRLKDAGARLLRATRGRGVTLPVPEVFGLPEIETPRFVLRLTGEPLRVEGELAALYRAREVSLFDRVQMAASDDGRDIDGEDLARKKVLGSGLVVREDDDGVAVTDEQAIAFWQSGLHALRTAEDPPIEVELSPVLARVRIGKPLTGRVHVVLEGNWLGTRLEFASHDLPVELGEIRAALARKKRWVTLDDGTLSRISESIEALANEAEEVMDGKEEASLPAHQLGRLDRWIEENDGQMDASVDALRKRLRALAVSAEPSMPRGLRATLRPYQRLGLAWLQFLQALGAGGILADDMGLGKTITTLAFLQKRKEKEGSAPSLVVCPTSVATNWVSEAARFTPKLRVSLHHGTSPSERARSLASKLKSDVIVTTYALLRRDLDALSSIPFRCVILDEAQNIKNADSATRRAASRLDATMRLALSGTPIENRLRELWSLASFVNPGILGTSRAFETRFERPISADRGSPLAAELRAVVRPFILRRTKDDVLPELPLKTEVDRMVTMTSPDKRMYDALAHALRESLAREFEKRKAAQTSLSVFTALTRLRQMACDPRLIDKRLSASRSAKRETFLELVRELISEGRRSLVFSQFVQLLSLWRTDLDREGIAYEYLDGSTTKRDAVVARFQNGTAPLFLISLKAGGAGLNLTAADTVIHCDPWWNPAVEDQATDRAYRIGQDKPVTVVRLIARGTIEEKMLSLKAKKRELTNAVIADDARALEGITEADIRVLFGDDDAAESHESPTSVLATSREVLDDEFYAVAAQAQRWLLTTGRLESELASTVDIPVPYASRLARGEAFPCSRAVADRIRAKLRAW